MTTITNVPRVIDNSGEVPVETPSNPVQTVIQPVAPPREIAYHYDLSRGCCPCNDCCMHNSCGGNGGNVYVNGVVYFLFD